jgi:hypothetical protein
MAKDIAALKAVSQNLMHSNISITDGVYGILSEKDTKEQIMSLGQKVFLGDRNHIRELKEITELFLNKLVDRQAQNGTMM